MVSFRQYLRYLPPIIWMVLIFAFSSRPDLPRNQIVLLDFAIKKTAHIFEYLILVILWFRALGPNSLFTAFLISLFYSFTDETHQLFVPGRGGLLRDVAIDSVGMLLGVIYLLYFSKWKKRS